MAVLATVRKTLADGDVDFLREGMRVLAQAVMEAGRLAVGLGGRARSASVGASSQHPAMGTVSSAPWTMADRLGLPQSAHHRQDATTAARTLSPRNRTSSTTATTSTSSAGTSRMRASIWSTWTRRSTPTRPTTCCLRSTARRPRRRSKRSRTRGSGTPTLGRRTRRSSRRAERSQTRCAPSEPCSAATP